MPEYVANYESISDALDAQPDALVEQKTYKRIWKKYDSQYPKAGKEIMKYGALNPISTACPDIQRQDITIRSRINIMILANPGAGKSQFMDEVEKLTPSPYPINKETDADVQKSIARQYQGYQPGNIIVNDLKNIMEANMLKSFEEIIEDGRVRRSTDTYTIDEEVDVSLFGGGVPDDLQGAITGGFLFRVVPIKLDYNQNEQFEVGDHIASGIAGNVDLEDNYLDDFTLEDIREYYDFLYTVLKGRYNEHNGVSGYRFTEEQVKDIKDKWKDVIKEANATRLANWFRQLLDCFRFAAVCSVVNYPHRETVENSDGTVDMVVADEDVKYAKALMKNGICLIAQYLTDEEVRARLEEIEKHGTEESERAMDRIESI